MPSGVRGVNLAHQSNVQALLGRRRFLRDGSIVAAAFCGAQGRLPGVARQRITGYELIKTRVPMDARVREAWQRSFFRQGRFQTHYEPVIVRLFSDDGLVGTGDADMPEPAARRVLDSMIGSTAWEHLLDDSLGGILVAVYDLIGKAVGLPVAKLFASKTKSHIQQTWWSQCYAPELMASEAKLGADLGYRVYKIKARPWEDPVAQAEAICEVIPQDMRVSVDANGWWGSVGRTLHFTRGLSKFHHYFAIESPFPRERIDAYRQLKGRTALQVAEHIPADPMPFIREGLVDAFVVGKPMGRTLVQRALMAESTRIPLWVQHSISSGVNQVFQAHQAAAFPGIAYAISITHVLEDDLMLEPFSMEDGFYKVPTKPGLGVSLDMDAIDRYRVG